MMPAIEFVPIITADWNRDFVRLSDVADVETGLDHLARRAEPFVGKIAARLPDQMRQTLLEIGEADRVAGLKNTRRIVARDIRCEHAERGQHAGMSRDKNRADVERPRNLACVHCARTAEGYEGKRARIMTALD